MFEKLSKNHSKIANSEKTPRSNISQYNFSKTCIGKMKNMIYIIIQTRLLLQFNILIKRVVQ